MTTRHAGYVVTLAEDIREDDAEEGVLNAIRHIKGVVSVEPVESDPIAQMAKMRARTELGTKLWDVLHPRSVK